MARSDSCTVLIIEDDAPLCALMTTLLRRAGFQIDAVGNGAAAKSLLPNCDTDVIVLDLMLPGLTGFDLLEEMSASSPELLQRVVVTTAASERTLARLDTSKIFALLRKPFDIDGFVNVIDGCAHQPRTSGNLHGKSPAPVAVGEDVSGLSRSTSRAARRRGH